MAGGRRRATEFPICAVEAYSEGLNFWKGSRGENKTFGPSRARIRRRQRTIAGQSKGRFRCQTREGAGAAHMVVAEACVRRLVARGGLRTGLQV
ncbi:uncharacterized protein LOC105774840 isoform X2 [Gossypium raimondii]|uniref:uncharacterized protein LOC105774840 isoform X2 n=1 Tax=Gossypium raimondii TaxID=29730 RepID=UPI00063A8FF7|nr:uncharacterized protein LOC105774840 isoform X2 [Gossypium raimondii]